MQAGKWQSLGAGPFPLSDVNLVGWRLTAFRGLRRGTGGWFSGGEEGGESRGCLRRICPSSIYRPIFSRPGLKFHRPSSARGWLSPCSPFHLPPSIHPPINTSTVRTDLFRAPLTPPSWLRPTRRSRHSIIIPSTGRPVDRCPPRTPRSTPSVFTWHSARRRWRNSHTSATCRVIVRGLRRRDVEKWVTIALMYTCQGVSADERMLSRQVRQ